MPIQNATNLYGVAKWIVDPVIGRGTHTTITAAINSASSGQTIFVRPGIYTEDPTLKAGVNVCAFDCDALTPNVTINGMCSFSGAGTVTISGINLQTNSNFCIAVTGSADSNLYLENCYINALNNTAISYTSSSSSSSINLYNCSGDIGTTGIAFFSDSSAGATTYEGCTFLNSGGSTTASTKSSGVIKFWFCNIFFPVVFSSSDVVSGAINCNLNTNSINATSITTSGVGTFTLVNCRVVTGSASALSAGAGTTLVATSSTINSTATNAITGAGQINYGGLAFVNSLLINTSTQVPLGFQPGLLLDSTGSSGTTGQVPIATTGSEFTWGSGGGGGGITTIDGNTSSVTGSTVTIATPASTGTLNFSGSVTTLTLNLMDANGDLAIGNSASATGHNSVSLGTSATDGGGPGNVTIGNSTTNSYYTGLAANVVIGDGANVSGPAGTGCNSSVTIGAGAFGGSGDNVSIGHNTSSSGNSVVVMGSFATDNAGGEGVVIGALAKGPSGGYSVILGYNSGSSNTSGGSNITINNTGASGESNVTRIGTQGTGNGQQNACYVAGIFNTNSSGFTSPLPVFVDSSTGQLGYGSSGGSGITTIDGDSGSVTGSTVTITGASSAGATVKFVGSGTTLSLDTSDGSGITQRNTFIGLSAGNSSYTGSKNTGVGYNTLHAITSGTFNAAFGGGALATLTTGTGNMVLGQGALQTANGSFNVGIGYAVGFNYTGTESSNILIQNQGVLGENNVIRIGTQGTGSTQQNVCYIAGIFGATTSDVGSTTAVLIDNTGNLGTISSSIRYKENVKPLYNSSSKIYDLSPVSFNYKSDSSKTTQYGLIAEEVEKVFPHLVVHDMEGRPESVKYHELPIFLLAEMKKMKAELDELKRAK